MGLFDRIQNAYNAFMSREPTYRHDLGASFGSRPDRMQFTRGNERSIVTAVYNRIGVDVAAISIRHVRTDDNNRYLGDIKSDLNNCLTLSANIDQTGRALIQDATQSMLDEGVVCIAPIDTDENPMNSDSYKIYTMRTARIIEWMPRHVKVRAYDDRTGEKRDVIFRKDKVSIVENPFFQIMNEHNSTMQRLIRKLNLLDAIDEQSGSGKMDLIIQLPYVIKSDARRVQAEERRREIEKQLRDSKYGIAYTDGTEHITQLNRSVENNLLTQIEYLTNMLYSQLGITQSIMDGTADEKTLNNYYNRTIEPILSAITEEMTRKFLTQTARTQGQAIMYFRSLFKLVPVTEMAELADKLTRNEIMTSNEVRQIMGMKPSDDPNADQLRNKNINQSDAQMANQYGGEMPAEAGAEPSNPEEMSGIDLIEHLRGQLTQLDEYDAQLDEFEKELG